ncbi:MAG: PepSY domain-containing protein [Nitrospira sp.]|nr:PepSY domain-containing protein [Nitrospira sp.]
MSLGFSRILTLSAVVLATGTMTMTGSAYGEPNKVEMAAAAKVSIDEAIKTASEKVSGMVIEAELKQKQDRLIWELEVVTPEKAIMEVHIDAETGSVIDVGEEKTRAKKVKRKETPHKQP